MTAPPDHEVVVTGIGIVTSLGIGTRSHLEILAGPALAKVNIDETGFAPYTVHPMPEIDWSAQIPRRGDQRQMENWQRLGVYAAGLALDDAGMKGDEALCGSMDMIVAAGGGERDVMVDSLIVDEAAQRNDREILLNEKLTTELRPTLFLAQLSNLLAGNISIVHKVTGSSRTFMGEEGAGISTFETALNRIKAGQSSHMLVGGAYAAERGDMLLLFEAVQALGISGWKPVWKRSKAETDGILCGSMGVFVVLESLEHARKRQARFYARLDAVEGARCKRQGDRLERQLSAMAETFRTKMTASDGPVSGKGSTVIFSGAGGMPDLTMREHAVLQTMFPQTAIRGYATLFGHGMETQFPLGIALAALSIAEGKPVIPFDLSDEKPMTAAPSQALVSVVGHARGEGMALLSAFTS